MRVFNVIYDYKAFVKYLFLKSLFTLKAVSVSLSKEMARYAVESFGRYANTFLIFVFKVLKLVIGHNSKQNIIVKGKRGKICSRSLQSALVTGLNRCNARENTESCSLA